MAPRASKKRALDLDDVQSSGPSQRKLGAPDWDALCERLNRSECVSL